MSKLDTLRESGIEEIFSAMLSCDWERAYGLIDSYKDKSDRNLSIATTCLRLLVRDYQISRYMPSGYSLPIASIDEEELEGLEGWVDDLFYAVDGLYSDDPLSIEEIESLDDDRRSDQILLAWLGMSNGVECSNEELVDWFESAFGGDDWRTVYCRGILAQNADDAIALRKAIEALEDQPVLQAYLISSGTDMLENGKPFSSLEDLEKSLSLLESRLGKQDTFTQTARLALISGLQREGKKEKERSLARTAAENEVFWRREIVTTMPLDDADIEHVIEPIVEKLSSVPPETQNECKDRASALYALGFFPSTSTQVLCGRILAVLDGLDDAVGEEILGTIFKYYEGDKRERALVELASALLPSFKEYSELWHLTFERMAMAGINVDTRAALERAKEYQRLCEGHYSKDDVDYWTPQMIIGTVYMGMGNHSRARRYWKTAVEAYERLAPQEMGTEIRALRIQIGKSLSEDELYEEALEVLTCLGEDTENLDGVDIMDAEECIGDALGNLDRIKEAQPHFEKLRQTAKDFGYPERYLQATIDLANIHSQLGEEKKCLMYFKEARDFAREVYGERSRQMANVLGLNAAERAQSGYLKEALALAEEGLKCDLDAEVESLLYYAMAMAYEIQGKQKEADRYMALARKTDPDSALPGM